MNLRLPLPASLHEELLVWLHQHRMALLSAIGYIKAAPLGTLLTVIAIAISLALPIALFLTIDTISQGLGGQNSRQINAFMNLSVDKKALHEIAVSLEKRDDIEHIDIIDRDESLQRFRDNSGLGNVLDLLPDNPLPAVLVIHPTDGVNKVDDLEALARQLESHSKIDEVALDREWMAVVFSTLQAFKRYALVMALLFSVLVGLVIYNGLRIEVLRHRHEIEVVKLVGGSEPYIQRPFHYHAVILGATGGLLAAAFIGIIFAMMQPHFDQLGAAYNTSLKLHLTLGHVFTLLLLAVILSLIASRISLGRLLRDIRP